ncbi:unnamed protein product [Heterobilharzia americana]|nr:unnamed protein product [Heterobilharzia americana]CAH8601387.1 unnamed protein product [Heterobilharzia americana]
MTKLEELYVPDDFDVEIHPGWTRSEIIDFMGEADKCAVLYLTARKDEMEKVVAQFRMTALNSIARLPDEILNKPYFNWLQQHHENTGKAFLDLVVSDAKKRSRLQWEDRVRTLTQKKLCSRQNTSTSTTGSEKVSNPRPFKWPSVQSISEDDEVTKIAVCDRVAPDSTQVLAGCEKRLPIASTPKLTEPGVFASSSTNRTSGSRTLATGYGNKRALRTHKNNTTVTCSTTGDTLSIADKTMRPHSAGKMSKEMRDRLLSKVDHNDMPLSSLEADHLRHLIRTLQAALNRNARLNKKR